MTDLQRDLDFLYEMGCLRFVPRTWNYFGNPDFATVTEHSYRMQWLALHIAKGENCTDTEKILKMVLVHDITEIRTNDVNYLSRQYVIRDEEKAIKDILGGTSLMEEFLEIWHEYEAKQSAAAKIVKDADNLDVDLELRELAEKGNTLPKTWAPMREFVAKEKLFTKTAKKIWEAIQHSDPHHWHHGSNNRFHEGDWAPPGKKEADVK